MTRKKAAICERFRGLSRVLTATRAVGRRGGVVIDRNEQHLMRRTVGRRLRNVARAVWRSRSRRSPRAGGRGRSAALHAPRACGRTADATVAASYARVRSAASIISARATIALTVTPSADANVDSVS